MILSSPSIEVQEEEEPCLLIRCNGLSPANSLLVAYLNILRTQKEVIAMLTAPRKSPISQPHEGVFLSYT